MNFDFKTWNIWDWISKILVVIAGVILLYIIIMNGKINAKPYFAAAICVYAVSISTNAVAVSKHPERKNQKKSSGITPRLERKDDKKKVQHKKKKK